MSELLASDADRERIAAPPAGRGEPRRWDSEHVRAYLGVSLMLLVIWALTGAGYFWPIWPMLGWGVAVVADTGGRLGRPCCRRSSNPGYSTGRWPSSRAAAPGSGEPPL